MHDKMPLKFNFFSSMHCVLFFQHSFDNVNRRISKRFVFISICLPMLLFKQNFFPTDMTEESRQVFSSCGLCNYLIKHYFIFSRGLPSKLLFICMEGSLIEAFLCAKFSYRSLSHIDILRIR